MHTTYFDQDDILVIRLSDKPIVREVSQNWNTHISYQVSCQYAPTTTIGSCHSFSLSDQKPCSLFLVRPWLPVLLPLATKYLTIDSEGKTP